MPGLICTRSMKVKYYYSCSVETWTRVLVCWFNLERRKILGLQMYHSDLAKTRRHGKQINRERNLVDIFISHRGLQANSTAHGRNHNLDKLPIDSFLVENEQRNLQWGLANWRPASPPGDWEVPWLSVGKVQRVPDSATAKYLSDFVRSTRHNAKHTFNCRHSSSSRVLLISGNGYTNSFDNW